MKVRFIKLRTCVLWLPQCRQLTWPFAWACRGNVSRYQANVCLSQLALSNRFDRASITQVPMMVSGIAPKNPLKAADYLEPKESFGTFTG